MRTGPLVWIGLVAAAALPLAPALGQCTQRWFATEGVSGTDPANNGVFGLTTWDPDGAGPRSPVLVAAGYFSAAGGVPANNIAMWDGSTWAPLGDGISGGEVNAIAVLPTGELVVAGGFTTAGGVSVNNVAAWNGRQWSALGTGFNNTVWALAVSPAGDLYAGGMFTTAGGAPANRVAKWSGGQWTSLGAGTANGVGNIVYAITVLPDNSVVVGGACTSAGGVANRRYIARWTGSAWTSLGAGMNNAVLSLVTMPNGDVVAGGTFTFTGTVSASRISRWNGSAWAALGPGLNAQPLCFSVLENGDLIAGGHFFYAGGFAASKIARWDGAAWSPMGIGMDQYVFTQAIMPNGNLFVGGGFTTVDNLQSPYLARWAAEGVPQVTQDPQSQGGCIRAPVSFSVGASGAGDLTYQWRHDGQWIDGATSQTYEIAVALPADVGMYDCVVSNACGQATSGTTALKMCPGDYNCNGGIDGADVEAFFTVWETGNPAADLNSDGGVDGGDVAAFFTAWEGGC